MEQRPSWEINIHSASQEIPYHSQHLKVRYIFNKSLALTPILRHIYPDHNFPPYFHKAHSNIIFPSTPRSSEWFFPFWCCKQNFVSISHMCYMYWSSHLMWFHHHNNIWWRLHVMKLLLMQSSPASPHFLKHPNANCTQSAKGKFYFGDVHLHVVFLVS